MDYQGLAREGTVFVPRHVRRRLIILGLILTDMLMVFGAGLTATMLRFGDEHHHVNLQGVGLDTDYAVMVAATVLLLPVCLAVEHLYDIDHLFWGSGEFYRVARATTLAVVLVIIAAYLLHIDNLSRMWLTYAWVLATVSLVAGRYAFRTLLRQARRRGRFLRPTILIGGNQDAANLAHSVALDYTSGLAILGCFADERNGEPDCNELVPGVPLLGDTERVTDSVRRIGADAVLIVSSAFEHSRVSEIVSELRHLPIDVHVSSGLSDVLTARVLVRELGGTPIMLVRGTTLRPYQARTKRAFDIAFGSLVILLGLPLWLAVGAAIKLDSPGPIFYRQKRVGRDNSSFGMYKFRSMYVDADARLDELRHANEADGPIFKIKNDPRVTRVGRFLRRYSIDEFPQLINVLLGQMSVVGPRPPLPAETQQYTDRHSRRLEVAPGMTGLWQVSGRSDLSFDEMVRLDLFYIENWSLRYDLALVLRTIPSVVFANGAY